MLEYTFLWNNANKVIYNSVYTLGSNHFGVKIFESVNNIKNYFWSKESHLMLYKCMLITC